MRGLGRWAAWAARRWPAVQGLEAGWLRCYSTCELPDNLLPVVAIVGRPNVGKSALFNRLVRRREALVHDTPGGHVTRDYQEGVARLADLKFKAVDTSGLEPFLPGGTIQARATALTAGVLRRSDVALLLIDGQTGALPADHQLAKWLRKTVLAAGSNGSSSGGGTSTGGAPAGTGGAGEGRCRLLLAANKCERRGVGGEAAVAAALAEAVRLGFGEPVALSAMTGEGLADLYQALQPLLDPLVEARRAAVAQLEAPAARGRRRRSSERRRGGGVAGPATAGGEGQGQPQEEEQAGQEGGWLDSGSGSGESSSADTSEEAAGAGSSSGGPLKIAIMGLPNVGKSTLANWLLQEERCLTGPEPGLTRDAIKERLTWRGQEVELVDTAGWIRRTRLARYDESGGAVAEQTVAEARSVMQFVHVVALLVDAERALELKEGLTHREVTLAADVVAEGRLLLIVANKLDALSPAQRDQALALIRQTVEGSLPDVSGVPVIGMSALTGRGAEQLLPTALTMYDRWTTRVPTAQLNRWVEKKAAEYRVGGGQEMNRITYISQVKARPPTFVAWVSGSTPLSVPSRRFVAKEIRKQFGFSGCPVRIQVRHKQPRKRQRQRGKR